MQDDFPSTARFMITKVINPLVGSVIVGAVEYRGEDPLIDKDDAWILEDYPCIEEPAFGLKLRKPDGSEVVLWVDQDAEGNGPGWLTLDRP